MGGDLVEYTYYGRASATSKGHGRENKSTADIEKTIDPSTYAACERVRRSLRRHWERANSLVFLPNTHITLTYNLSQRPEMQAVNGAVSDDTWKKYMSDKKKLIDKFRREHKCCSGIYNTELCKTRAIHIHLALYVEEGYRINWEDYFRGIWKGATGCSGKKMVKVTFVSEEESQKLLSYLYTQSKVPECAALCAGYTKGKRTIAGFVNDPLCYVPQKMLLPESLVNSINHSLSKYYRVNAAGRKLTSKEKKHLTELTSHFGVRHGFQGNELNIINEILQDAGYPPIELKKDLSSNINFSKKEIYVYSPE